MSMGLVGMGSSSAHLSLSF